MSLEGFVTLLLSPSPHSQRSSFSSPLHALPYPLSLPCSVRYLRGVVGVVGLSSSSPAATVFRGVAGAVGPFLACPSCTERHRAAKLREQSDSEALAGAGLMFTNITTYSTAHHTAQHTLRLTHRDVDMLGLASEGPRTLAAGESESWRRKVSLELR